MVDKSLYDEALQQVYKNLASDDSSPSRGSLNIASESILKQALENVKNVREFGYSGDQQRCVLTTAGVSLWTATKIVKSMEEKS